MGIDVDELRHRIDQVRNGAKITAKPQMAHAAPGDIYSTFAPKQGRLATRLYSMPVIGYGFRILAAIYNFPRILHNLTRHYSAYHAEITRLNGMVAELRHQADVTQRIATLADGKAERLQRQLDQLLAEKADAEIAPLRAAAAPEKARVEVASDETKPARKPRLSGIG